MRVEKSKKNLQYKLGGSFTAAGTGVSIRLNVNVGATTIQTAKKFQQAEDTSPIGGGSKYLNDGIVGGMTNPNRVKFGDTHAPELSGIVKSAQFGEQVGDGGKGEIPYSNQTNE